MADNTYYGAGTYNEGTYQPYQVAPDSAGDVDVVGAPDVFIAFTIFPDGINDAETSAGPDTAATGVTSPGSASDTETTDPPSLTSSTTAAPGSASDGETFDGVTTTAPGSTAPDGINDAELLAISSATTGVLAYPDSIADAETMDAPSADVGGAGQGPSSLSDGETLGAPAVTTDATVTPDPAVDAESFDAPSTSSPTAAAPDSISDAEVQQGPTVAAMGGGDNLTFGTGTYNQGIYYGTGLAADQSATQWDTVDAETLGAPTLSFVANANPNYNYGDGPYGVGTYFGTEPPKDTGALPLFPPQPYEYRQPAQHIMGIGPWSAQVAWAGAINYGVTGGKRVARPAVGLPAASSKSFTLRLNDGGEARADYTFTRDKVIIPEKMHTDLWWRRKEPTTGAIEVIGRFNTSSADVSTRDEGISVSVSWIDYRTLLGERMVLKYLDTMNSETQWDKNTPLVEIMRFAVPTNMGLNLAMLDPSDPAGLGSTTYPFEIPLGSTITEVFDNLLSISPNDWEWWVEMPEALDAAPKLMFTTGQRGSDKGIVLADTGGPSPIASWTMNASADQYANSLYFTGADGGDVAQNLADIAYYGQRDASDSDSSVKGTKDADGLPYLLDRAAKKRLIALSDLRPTYTITLVPGWWRGRNHIDIGDSVSIFIRLGAELLTGKFRVTELAVSVDDTNGEDVQLTLGKPLSSGNPRSRRSALARIVARLKNYERRES